jgi:serine/threonine protein kinase
MLAEGPKQIDSERGVETMELEAGVQIGDFEIEGRIGSGGMGIVYRARQLSLNRVVALKILGPALNSEAGQARFRREAQAIAKLNHPGIASIHFIGQDQQVCFFAMEYIDGASLRQVMDRLIAERNPGLTMESVVRELMPSISWRTSALVRFDEPTAPDSPPSDSTAPNGEVKPRQSSVSQVVRSPTYVVRCCEIARDVAQALSHAHERGVVHRDIKPENLLLDGAGKIHVVDFGLARFHEDMTLTNTGALVGTPMYMSPEQVSGRLEIDHRTDVYSLGFVLYEMLTLRRPIEAATREGVLRQVMTKSRPPLSRKNPAVSRDLESVVHKAIAHDPDERYESAAALAHDLQNVVDRKSVIAPPYRYKADLSEIAAARPRAVTLVSIIVLIVLSISSFNFGGLFIDLRPFLDAARLSPAAEASLFAVFFIVVMFVVLAPSVCLYLGYAWARWVTSVYLVLHLASYLWISRLSLMRDNLFVSAVWISAVALILVILFRRQTRDWLMLAKRVRAEQRAWRSVSRE